MKRPEIKPLFAVKSDFVDSLNQFTHEALSLYQAVEVALKHDGFKNPRIAEIIRERLDSFKKAME